MNNSLIKTLLTFSLVLVATSLMAQPPTPPATPIDGGLGILLAGGAAYGLKRLKESRKR